MLKATQVKKTYNAGKKIALQDFSIDVPAASIYGLLGPNGAGKTSFIRIINQITKADEGEILIDGEKLNPNHIRNIGYMPEERGLYKNMTVGDQLLYFGDSFLFQLFHVSDHQCPRAYRHSFFRVRLHCLPKRRYLHQSFPAYSCPF